MISRRKFAVYVISCVLFAAIWINYSFLQDPPETHRNSRRSSSRHTRSVENSNDLAAQRVLSNTEDGTAALDSVERFALFDDRAVRRGIHCRRSRVSLELRLPDIAINRSMPSSCACAKAVSHDVDHGLTLSHVMKRYFCTHPTYALATEGRTMRIVQVGANTGDNANDHLVNFLKSSVAQGVLLEPVPWIFRRLSKTYEKHSSATVRLINAAMSEQDGNVSFMAPNEKSSGWLPQMGGLHLPPKTLKTLSKKGGLRLFDKITVQSLTFESLLALVDWHRSKYPPDVFVVDAEGYDAVIVSMVLDAVASLFGQDARIPIVQFEWKHIGNDVRIKLWDRLIGLGYCVMQVHYDDVAIHAAALSRSMDKILTSVEGASSENVCEIAFDLAQ